MGRFAEKDEEAEKAALEEEERQAKLSEGMKVGDRCEVRLAKDSEAKRGTVMFVGESMSSVYVTTCLACSAPAVTVKAGLL